MRKVYLTILTVLVLVLATGTAFAQQRDNNGGYGGRYGQVNQMPGPAQFDPNQDRMPTTGIISRTDPNGGYGGYYPGKGPGSPCVGCGPTGGGQGPGNGYPGMGGRYGVPPTPVPTPNPINNFNNTFNNQFNNTFYRPMLQEVELQATGTGFGILRDYFAAKFQTSGQLKVQREKSETDKQLAMMQMQMQMQMMQQMGQQSQQRDTYRESTTRTDRYERDDRRAETEAPPERSMDVHVSNGCQFTVQLEVNGEVIKTLGSRHAVSISVPAGGQLTVLRMDGSVFRQYSHPGSEVVVQ